MVPFRSSTTLSFSPALTTICSSRSPLTVYVPAEMIVLYLLSVLAKVPSALVIEKDRVVSAALTDPSVTGEAVADDAFSVPICSVAGTATSAVRSIVKIFLMLCFLACLILYESFPDRNAFCSLQGHLRRD